MKYILVVFVLLVFILCSCNNKYKHEENPTTRINDKKYIQSLVTKAIEQGDSLAFFDLSNIYTIEARQKEIFYYAQIMANKYDNKDAHFLLYWTYIHPNDENSLKTIEQLKAFDSSTYNLTMFHLIKSFELKEKSSKYIVDEIFGDTVTVPSSTTYLKKYLNNNELFRLR